MKVKNLKTLALGLSMVFGANQLNAQLYYNESCKNATGLFSVYGNAQYTSGSTDPNGDGWLRLTNTTSYGQKGYVTLKETFPSTAGVNIEFDFKVWNDKSSECADGFSVFLFDGDSTKTFQIGYEGGNLGYYNLKPAYLGVGIDEYGNFIPYLFNSPVPYRVSSAISIADASYNYVASTGTNLGALNSKIEYTSQMSTRPQDNVYYRRVKIEITPVVAPAVGMNVSVALMTTAGGSYTNVINMVNVPNIPPDLLKIGFCGITGGSVAYHEVRNVIISTPAFLNVTKTFDCNSSEIITTIGKGVSTPINGITVADTLPAGFKVSNIRITGGTFVSQPVAINLSDGRTAYTYTVNAADFFTKVVFAGNLSALINKGDSITSSASITPPSTYIDNDLSDNYVVKTLNSNVSLAFNVPNFFGQIDLKGNYSGIATSKGLEYKKDSDANWTNLNAGANFEASAAHLSNGKYYFRAFVEVECGTIYSETKMIVMECDACK